jgi:hypothetical protein
MNKIDSLSKMSCSVENKISGKNKFEFKEILCPLTKNTLVSDNCVNCKYVQRIKAKHNSGRTLTTLICLFNFNNEGE